MSEQIAAALVAALVDLSIVETTRTATIPTKSGGEFSYSFADLGDVTRATRPKLAEHGIVALTPIHAYGGELACTVTLLHSSGERLDFGPFPFPHGRDAQATGSSVTYHRRYALLAALGMAAGDDDDGAGAQPRQQDAGSSRGGSPAGSMPSLNERVCASCGEPIKPNESVVKSGDGYAHKECAT